LWFPQRKLLSAFPLPSSQRQWKNYHSLRPLCLKRSPAGAGQAGGEYKLIYLHSEAGTFSLPEGIKNSLERNDFNDKVVF
jgi:hypothetical protein